MSEAGFDLIQKRLAALQRENEEDRIAFEARLARRQAEADELLQARKVLERLVSGVERQPAKAQTASAMVIPREGTPRPKDIPTVRQMIDALLAEAETHGKRGLTGRELVVAISARWWPGVGWNSVLPTAHRLVGNDRLGREDGLFVRVQHDGEDQEAA